MTALGSSSPSSCIALDVRMWRHSGIGVYLRGLVGALAARQDAPAMLCMGDLEAAAQAASGRRGWQAARYDAPIYSLREQLFPPKEARACALWHAPHYNLPLRWPAERPLVVTIHDLIHLQSPHPLKRAYMRFFLARLAARGRAAGGLRVLAVSQATRRRLLDRLPDLDADTVRVAPHGLDARFLSTVEPDEAAKWRRARALPDDYILIVGIDHPHKNHDFALRALQGAGGAAGEMPVVLCGVGERGAARHAVAWPGLGRRLKVVPHLPAHEMPALFAGAALLLQPSLVEGFGLPILEAQSQGARVAAADRPATREAAGHAAEFFDPTDAEAMLAAIERAMARDDLPEAGRRRAAGRTWERSADATCQAYRELAGDKVFANPRREVRP